MGPFARSLSPVRKALRAFFSQDVKLRKGDDGVQIVFQERGADPSQPPSREELRRLKEQRELALAREDLARVLDAVPRGRSVMRQLAYIEYALEKKGWRGLYKVPYAVLPEALEQLESQVTNWSPEGLACLRSKMAVAVGDRADEAEHASPPPGETRLEAPAELAARVIEQAAAPAEGDEAAALAAAYAALGLAAAAETAAPAEAEAARTG